MLPSIWAGCALAKTRKQVLPEHVERRLVVIETVHEQVKLADNRPVDLAARGCLC